MKKTVQVLVDVAIKFDAFKYGDEQDARQCLVHKIYRLLENEGYEVNAVRTIQNTK